MKKIISLILVMVIVLSNATVVLGKNGVIAQIYSVNDITTFSVNETVDLKVKYSGAKFGALSAKIDYDKEFLELQSTSSNVIVNEETGDFSMVGIDVDEMIGEFTFKAIKNGETKVSVNFIEGVTYDFEPFECNNCDMTLKVMPDLFGQENSIRIFGADRFLTSQAIGKNIMKLKDGNKHDVIVVTSGIDYPDALGGTYLAAANNAPIITVSTSEYIESNVSEYIKNNLQKDGTVYILGGTGVVSSRFENLLNEIGINTIRLGGKDRFETNLQILNYIPNNEETLLICSAFGYADSLSASATGKPIMLVGKDFTDAQKKHLERSEYKEIYIIGGEGAVNKDIRNKLETMGFCVDRVYGNNRYETSVAVANEFFGNKSQCVVVASGLNFPDGLCGGPLAYQLGSPLILTALNDTSHVNLYMENSNTNKTILLGGKAVVGDI